MKDTTQSQTHVYYIKMGARILLCFIYLSLAAWGFCLAILLVGMLQTDSFNGLGLFVWLGALSLMLFFAYVTIPLWNTRLELSPEGVTYTNPGYCRIYTPWENIERIVRLSLFPTRISFILRSPATINIKFLEGRQQPLAVIERCSLLVTKSELLQQACFIPFMALPKKDLKNGTFNTYLQQYAPHLACGRTNI